MSTLTTRDKKRRSATVLDREMEQYSLKLLNGDVRPEDEAEYENLIATRKQRLVKLRSAKKYGHSRWFKSAS